MNLESLIKSLPAELEVKLLQPGMANSVTSLVVDSRKVESGSLFVALKGSSTDGHQYVAEVVERGCVCVFVETPPKSLSEEVKVVQVNDTHKALGELAAAINDFPAHKMCMIGLTGTNGKTTISWMIEQMLQSNGFRVGVIGTINYRYPDKDGKQILEPAPLTTPDALLLQRLLSEMAEQGVTHVVMETSSHALAQKRLQGILFDFGVFTNLSRDHLDYHGSMDEYFKAKQKLFLHYLKDKGTAIIVTDPGEQDEHWGTILCDELIQKRCDCKLISCGFDTNSAVSVQNLQEKISGFTCQLSVGGTKSPLNSGMTGRYNVLNILAAVGVGIGYGLTVEQIISGLEALGQVPGRLERITIPGLPESKQPAVFVDYAHTPDALNNVLQTLKKLCSARLICIFGCGGDRDKGKRSLMGEIAGKIADISIITSDNPRSENPQTIIASIAEGLEKAGVQQIESHVQLAGNENSEKVFTCIQERENAIRIGLAWAVPGDIVLIAGKGHETYQLLQNTRIFFDDRLSAFDAMIAWNSSHLLKATRGQVFSGKQSVLFKNVSTDTRKLETGDIFVALEGDTFDGHDYIETAINAGAGAVIIHRDIPNIDRNVLVIRVQDTLRALGDLATYRRGLFHRRVKVAAITGSSGKTTVKEMTSAIFSKFFAEDKNEKKSLLKTAGNFNNLIGLPLSLLPLSAGHTMAVLEMGMNRPGEIERLTEIADPDIACITNVQAAHLEGLGSIQGVAKAKGELFAGMRPNTVSVVNFDDSFVRKLHKNSKTVIGFAVTAAGRRFRPIVRATRIANLGEHGMRFTLHIADWKKRVTVPAPGEHNVSNCAAAAAIAYGAGIPPEIIVEALADYRSVDKRMQFMTLPGGIQVLNDCYNANPSSMRAALKTVSSFGNDCRRIALLGDMLELGEDSPQAHVALGRQVAGFAYDQLLVAGGFASQVVQGAYEQGMAAEKVQVFSEHRDIVDWLYRAMVEGRISEGDWMLVKGSRGMQMEKVLEGLEQRFATGIARN